MYEMDNDSYSSQIPMYSLIAALFVVNDFNDVKFTDVSECMSYLGTEKRIYVTDSDDGIDKISKYVVFDYINNRYHLRREYSDVIDMNGKKISTKDYFYNLATPEIIKYCEEYKEEETRKRTKGIA